MEKNYFLQLNAINCNEHTEKKNGLTYLSWAWAWAEVKKNFPEAFYTIYENKDGWNYHTDGRTCWVKTGVTIEGLEHIEYLPVMDFRNASIPAEKVTSFDVNKAIQRSLTKACARHGLGLYIYAGEDLPEEGAEARQAELNAKAAEEVKQAKKRTTRKVAAPEQQTFTQPDGATYWGIIRAYAEGRPTKTGGDYREAFIENFHPDAEAILKFDNDVENFKFANNL